MWHFPKVDHITPITIPLEHFPDLGGVNVYVLGTGPITLIDTGPNFPGSYEYLKAGLKQSGYEAGDIERIMITHGHLDHFGLAASLRRDAGHSIPCFIHKEDVSRVISKTYHKEIWKEYSDQLMAMVGMPQGEVTKIKEQFFSFDSFCDPIADVIPMDEGDRFKGDEFEVRLIHTPGHSPGACCLYEPQQRILFSGDHILKHITPNPIMEIDRNRLRDPHYQSLGAYLNSLEKLTSLDARFVFPGHGEYIEDLPGVISTYRIHHRQRMDLVWNALRKESRPLYYLIGDVFPSVGENEIFLAISEILVHLEILVDHRRVELVDSGPPAMYRALE
jgi:glyoxylase-like metal-dependent hydrolase (beta-lactamase superfamily II)